MMEGMEVIGMKMLIGPNFTRNNTTLWVRHSECLIFLFSTLCMYGSVVLLNSQCQHLLL